MTKKEILQQIRSEMAAEDNEIRAKRDAAFYDALAKDGNLSKSEFLKTYKDGGKKPLTLQQRYTLKLIEQSGFKTNAPKMFSEKLNINDQYKKIYAALTQYCEKFPATAKHNIIFTGAPGTGKTYAVHIIANNLLEKGFSVFYITAFNLVKRFKNYVRSFNDDSELDALFECDLLIIDDFGAEPSIENITQEYLYNVINERLISGKHFIITTNLDTKNIAEKYDQRIASRILSKESSVVIEMKSDDLRLKKM